MQYRHRRSEFQTRALSTCSVLAMAAASTAVMTQPAFAQEAEASDRVVVTGSRIQRQDYTANSPIVTIDSSTFEETSTIGIETVLNQLPQFIPALQTQFNTTDVQPTATNTVGSSTVSLRGLGANRSLVLVDGRRATPINATLAVDTNTIPSSAIQRVEIISGGASAVYGADAVGGVVNFILRNNFEGLDISTRYGISQEGDGSEFQVSGLFGANFADGRGNVMFGMEHATRGSAEQAKRGWRQAEFADPFVNPNDFWFDGTYFGSLTAGNAPSQAAVDALFSEVDPGAVPNTSTFYINATPDGTGTVFSGVRSFFGASGPAGSYRYDGPFEDPEYPGLTWRKIHPDGSIGQNQLTNFVSRPMERYSMFGRGRFALTDNIDVIGMGTFARTKGRTILQPTAALGSNAAVIPYGDELYMPSIDPATATMVTYTGPGGETIEVPDYSTAQTLAAFRPGGAYGLNCPEFGGCTETQAFPLPAEVQALLNSRPNPNDDVTLNSTTHYLPVRQLLNNTVTYQVLFGLEGRLDNGWVWDAHISHGETMVETNMLGDLSRDRYRAVVSSPNFGRAFQGRGNEAFGGQRAGTAQCTTGLPLIASFIPSEDCIEAISAGLHTKQTIMQNAAEANLAGDLFSLPAGDLGFAAGAAYREYRYEYYVDNLNRFGSFVEQTMGARPGNDTFGSYHVAEVYGELLVPVIANVPFIEHFNLELGGRYSDYSTVGGVFTYKILGDWAVTPWARLRGGLNKATRAPNLAELYQSRDQTFAGTGAVMGDQCSENNELGQYGANPAANLEGAAGAAHARAICEGIMGAGAAAEYYGRPVADQPDPGGVGDPNTVGNPNVQPETAETWTVGVVLRSPFDNPVLSGFTLSVDYFRIDLKDMIATKNGDAIYQECLSTAFNPTGNPNIPACQAIVRDTVNGNAISVDATYTNEGRSLTEGIDVQVDWRGRFDDVGLAAIPGGLSLNVLASFNLSNTTQATPASNVIEWKGTQGCALQLQCMRYDYRVFTTLSYFTGPFNASLRWQHYPSVKSGAFATNPNTTAVGVPSSYNLFALSGSYRLENGIGLRAGIDNLFNKKPPLGGGNVNQAGFPSAQTRQGGGFYDPIGRRFWIGANVTL